MWLDIPWFRKLLRLMIILSERCKVEFFDQPEYVINRSDEIKNILNLFVDFFDILKLDLEISFCSENQIRELNKKFRGKDSVTNVLSFPDQELKILSKKCIGELLICQIILEREALDQGKTTFHHFIHLLIHSMLHILGYGHENENDAILMETKEVEFLSKIGVKDPYK